MTYLGVKFKTIELDRTFPWHPGIDELKKWCEEFYKHGFTPEGGGVSAGNLSFRIKGGEDPFIITAAGLASKSGINEDALSQVKSFNLENGVIHYCGQKKPSSESLVHAIIYHARKDIHAVFHGHSDLILKTAPQLGVVQTEKAESEGTKELANAVLEVLGSNDFIIMRDHGFISLGKTMKEAGQSAIKMQEKAMKT